MSVLNNNKRFRVFKTLVSGIAIVGLLGMSHFALAAKMTKMQEVRHASPMPNLMMLVLPSASKLGLTNEQVEQLKAWKRENNSTVRRLTKEIIGFENELRQATLEGVSLEDKNMLRDFIIESRSKLIDLRYLCVVNMQKTLSKDQWSQVMDLHGRQMRLVTSANKAGNEIQAFLRVSPMPKLMAIALMHAPELNLTPEQAQALEDRRLNHMNIWALLFDQSLRIERNITQDALAMVDAEKLMENHAEMSAKRHKMAVMSLECRDIVREVLTDPQWETMVKLLKDYMS